VPLDLAKDYDQTQPRDEDGRWTAAGAAGASALVASAGVAGGAVAASRVRTIRAAASQDVRAAVARVREVRAKNRARQARHAAAEASIARGLSSSPRNAEFIPTALRTLRSRANRAGYELRQHIAAKAERFWDPESGEPVWASSDAAGERRLRDRVTGLEERITDLRENGRAPRVEMREAQVHIAHVPEYVRHVRGPTIVEWRNPQHVIDMIAEAPDEFAEHGITSIKDVEDIARLAPRRHLRGIMRQFGLPVPQVRQTMIEQVVRNVDRHHPAHEVVIDGNPTVVQRRRLRSNLLDDLQDRRFGALDLGQAKSPSRRSAQREVAHAIATGGTPEAPAMAPMAGRLQAWLERELPRASDRVIGEHAVARWTVRPALRTLAMLRGNRRIALIGAGAVAGAGVAAGGIAAINRLVANRRKARLEQHSNPPLAKAADDPPPDPADAVYRAGRRAENSLAQNIAEMFGSWTRLPIDRLLQRSAALHTTLLTDLDQATRPLDAAVRGGAGVEVPVATRGADGSPRTISVSLDTGSERVNSFARQYRLKLAGSLADEQLQTIRSVLQDAAFQGQPTEVTARLLRQTIGLTPVQAGHVVSYRRALTALDPDALGRALRDARFDRTVSRAIDTDTPLGDDQINKMVDAYHRRYLAFRANTIARTEGLRAANNGHVDAVRDYLNEHMDFTVIKTWVSTTTDDRTRPDHVGLHGQQVIGLYTPFVAPNGDRILWPHQSDAPLRQVVRCRCTMSIALVPRTAAAQSGFSLVADAPP